jgi:hypothetical protein
MLSKLLVKSVCSHSPPFAGNAVDPHRLAAETGEVAFCGKHQQQ